MGAVRHLRQSKIVQKACDPTLYLLDRNAVSVIKTSNAGKAQKDARKESLLRKLKGIDTPSNWVSPLLSVLEGRKGKPDSVNEKRECLCEESDEIRRFFKSALTDSDFLESSEIDLAGSFADVRGNVWKARADFLQLSLPLVAVEKKLFLRSAIETQIIDLARTNGLLRGDPTLLIVLACLYESQDARRLLKPTKENIFNVLSDIYVIRHIGFLKSQFKRSGLSIRIAFVSDDKGLSKVLSLVTIAKSEVSADNELCLTMRYEAELFPALSKEQYLKLMQRVMPVEEHDL
jgi:hypothetical protein